MRYGGLIFALNNKLCLEIVKSYILEYFFWAFSSENWSIKCDLVSVLCCCSVTKPCLTLCNPMHYGKPGFLVHHQLLELAQTHVHWLVLLQGIFPTQGLNTGLCVIGKLLTIWATRKTQEYCSGYPAYPFSSGFSQPRNLTGVSCILGEFCISWATREVPNFIMLLLRSNVWNMHSWGCGCWKLGLACGMYVLLLFSH